MLAGWLGAVWLNVWHGALVSSGYFWDFLIGVQGFLDCRIVLRRFIVTEQGVGIETSVKSTAAR
jgi:hypothetical protein